MLSARVSLLETVILTGLRRKSFSEEVQGKSRHVKLVPGAHFTMASLHGELNVALSRKLASYSQF